MGSTSCFPPAMMMTLLPSLVANLSARCWCMGMRATERRGRVRVVWMASRDLDLDLEVRSWRWRWRSLPLRTLMMG